MRLRGTFILFASVFLAVGLAASQASAGDPPANCTLQIEVNTLRVSGRTIQFGPNKDADVTAKARILKGTAPSGTTIATTLQIEAIDGNDVLSTNTTGPITLGIGKGGKGAKLSLAIPRCDTGFINFVATFFGNDANNAYCEGTRSLRKTCK